MLLTLFVAQFANPFPWKLTQAQTAYFEQVAKTVMEPLRPDDPACVLNGWSITPHETATITEQGVAPHLWSGTWECPTGEPMVVSFSPGSLHTLGGKEFIRVDGPFPKPVDVPLRETARIFSVSFDGFMGPVKRDRLKKALEAAREIPVPPGEDVPSFEKLPKNPKAADVVIYDVWSAALASRGEETPNVLIQGVAALEAASAVRSFDTLRGLLPPELAPRFVSGLQNVPGFEPKSFSLPKPVVIFKENLKRKGQAVFGLSQVALSDDGNFAMVYVSHHRAMLDAGAEVLILRRKATGWVVEFRRMLRIS